MTDRDSELTTHSGFRSFVRTARPEDEAALQEFLEQSRPDLRLRFLTSITKIGHERLIQMTGSITARPTRQ